MTNETIIVLAFAALVSIIIVVVVWQLAASWRARAALARDDAYQKLSERSVQSQEATQQRIDRLATELGATNDRLAAIEKALTVID
jgi:hypothetical protein